MLILRPGLQFLGVEQKVGSACMWNLPGGKVEAEESPRTTAVREVFEETGFMCNPRFVRQLCKRKLSLGENIWLGHFFVYYGPLFTMEIREPNKIVSLRWLEGDEARSLQAHQNVFADIFDFALTRLRIENDPWTNQKCVERSNTSKRRNRETGLIFVS
jgi:8-oxo-dGTP pyrophosphatase MutT (NUDIX family)